MSVVNNVILLILEMDLMSFYGLYQFDVRKSLKP